MGDPNRGLTNIARIWVVEYEIALMNKRELSNIIIMGGIIRRIIKTLSNL
jgi:hypothetical protein